MTDSRAGERFMIIDPTGVPDALRGRGMGRGVEDAQSGATHEGLYTYFRIFNL